MPQAFRSERNEQLKQIIARAVVCNLKINE